MTWVYQASGCRIMLVMIRSCMTVAVASAALLLSGCASPVDDQAAKACALLLDAQNRVNNAVWGWVSAGKPAGGSDVVRVETGAYADRVTLAADAAPAELADEFAELRRLAIRYDVRGDLDSGQSMTLAGVSAVSACEAAGVDMPITNPRTGLVT